MTKQEILANVEEFDSPQWNAALAAVQAEIGVTDGDWAAYWFSGREDEWNGCSHSGRRLIIVEAYVASQIDWMGENV